MRRPNGNGSIVKLSGKRRRPFAVRVTLGWADDGKQIRKDIGYFEKRIEAERFWNEYNKNPNAIISDLTFSDIFKKWSNKKYNEVGNSSISTYEISFMHCVDIHHFRIQDIRTVHLQDVIDQLGDKYETKKKVLMLMRQIFNWAMKNDIVMKDYSRYIELGKKISKIKRTHFTKDEMDKLWENIHISWVDTILILIYTGLRIGELLNVKNENIDLVNKTIKIIKSKTAAGIRIVPIHSKILSLIENRYNKDKVYFITNNKGNQMIYINYSRKFQALMKELNMQHLIHDTRHTFATMLSNSDVNPSSITTLIGHNNFITTDKIYTHKDIEELKKAIESLN